MSKCTIKFDNNENRYYFAGETLSGTVELNLHEAKKCKGFFLTIEGLAQCEFTKYSFIESTIYRGSEKYLENITYLFGSKDGESMTIEAGIRTYSFSYKLPSDLPYSVQQLFGSIRYTVEATLDIPWRFNVYDIKEFKICQNDDLNLYPDLKIPSEKQYVSKLCCLIQPKPLFFEVSIPYTGYIGGDTINIAIKLINDRNYPLKIKIELVQKTTYTNRGAIYEDFKQEHKSKVMAKIQSLEVEKDTTADFIEEFVIPSTLENTNVLSCNILQITYEIEVTCIMNSLWSINPKVRIPITLGSIPLNFFDDFKLKE